MPDDNEHLLGGRFSAYSRIYMNIGLGVCAGYWFLVYILGHGGTAFFAGESLEDTLRSFEIFQIQAISTTPAMLAQLLAHCDQHPSIEVHVDTITSTGGIFPRALLERVRPRLCSHVVTRYGSTEVGGAAAAPAERIAHIEGAAGYVGQAYESRSSIRRTAQFAPAAKASSVFGANWR